MESDFKSLSRQELIEIIENRERELRQMEHELQSLRQRLNDRTVRLRDCGSIAEASIAVSDVFKAAQDAADVYIENAKRVESETIARCHALDKAAVSRAEQIIGNARRRADELLSTAAVQANEALNRAAAISAEKLGEADSVLRTAREDSEGIRDAALKYFLERSQGIERNE